MSLFRLIYRKNLIRSIIKQNTSLPTISNHRFLLFYKTQRYFSSNIEQIVVPNLGDSITEGTVTSIHKQIGEKVLTDDIVLEIETDKVSVDIRAPKDGYIAQFFIENEQDVEVGGPLYALSNEPVEGIDASAIKPQQSNKSDTPTPTPVAAPNTETIAPLKPQTQTQSHRVPMIKFRYGIREEVDKIINGISTPNGVSNVQQMSDDVIPFWMLPNKLKGIKWKEIDIEAVNSGGANYAEMEISNYDSYDYYG